MSNEALRQIEKAEDVLRELGFRIFRVRHHDAVARLEIARSEMARALDKAFAFKLPARAVAVVEATPAAPVWPEILREQLPELVPLLRAVGLPIVQADGELHLVASYARAAVEAGDDVIVVGTDKRFAQLVDERVWLYDANKDARYTIEMVTKRFGVPPAARGRGFGGGDMTLATVQTVAAME